MATSETSKDGSAEESAGFLRRLCFGWALPFFRQASRDISRQDFSVMSLPPFPHAESSESAAGRLAEHLAHEVARQDRTPSLQRALFQCWKNVFLLEFLRALLAACCFLLAPFLLRQTVSSLRLRLWLEAFGYLSAIAASGMVGGLLQQHGFHGFSHWGRQMWAALVGNIFTKMASIDAGAFTSQFSEGQVISMIGQDASIFPYMGPFLCIFLVMPCNILVPSAILLYYLREAFVVGFASCVVVSVLSSWAAVAYKRNVKAKLTVADSRLVLVNETLQGARSIKYCAWEAALEAKIKRVRDEEVRLLSWIHLCYALQQGATAALPVIGITASLLTHVALGRSLEADIVSMTVAYFDPLSFGFMLWPNCRMQLQTMSAGIARIERLLLVPEIASTLAAPEGAKEGICLERASFSWNGERLHLQEISLTVRPKELVMAVGPVASGKSTLVSGIFGLVRQVAEAGEVRILGQPAYVPQNPQVLNASVRENILFGLPLNEERYEEAIAACCLEQDLDQFVEGDATEIGEKGITISGGQRARIALARAYYADADVVVLDDPLSAMDAHIGASVFSRCILALRAQGKAILMTTNQIQLCSSADRILMLEAGREVRQGSFQETARELGAASSSVAVPSEGPEKRPTNEEQDIGAGVSRPQVLRPTAASGKSGMKAEGMLQGRLGVREWLNVAQGGQSTLLGLCLALSSLLVPLAMFLSNVLLATWIREAQLGPAFDYQRDYLLASLAFALCCTLRVSSAAMYFTKISRHLHQKMLASVLRQPLKWYDTTPLGRVLNRFSQDISLMDLQMPRLFEFAMQHFTVVFVGIIGASVLAWPALLVLLLIGWPIRRLQDRYGSVALNLQRLMLMATSPVMSQVSGFLLAMDTIRAFRRERHFVKRFFETMDGYYKTYYWIHAVDRLAMGLQIAVCVPFITLCLGASVVLLVYAGSLTPELGGLGLALTVGLAQRIPLYLWCWSTFEKFFGGAQRVAEYAGLPWEGDKQDHDYWKEGLHVKSAEKVVPGSNAVALELREVFLRYQPGLPLTLQGMSLAVRPGERLGICGRTGSGKSTLFLACFRMVEAEEGEIRVWGQSAKSLPLPELRASMAIVPQGPLMFSGSLRSNLDLHGQYSDAELLAALRLAHLEEQVQGMPGKLDEPVQEKGSNFSAGTVQLICIARLLLAKQRIVFLDECTASVDLKTDAQVQSAIRSACGDCAILCIAHRLDTIIDYDRLAVLDSGRVIETGSPSELLRQEGSFTSLVASMGDAGAEIRRKLAPGKPSSRIKL
ncbi:Abcc1 [Symbiodinium sp. CCMP2592]|nr:Abcc1 [Symbiodinium sp. CCMP2592]